MTSYQLLLYKRHEFRCSQVTVGDGVNVAVLLQQLTAIGVRLVVIVDAVDFHRSITNLMAFVELRHTEPGDGNGVLFGADNLEIAHRIPVCIASLGNEVGRRIVGVEELQYYRFTQAVFVVVVVPNLDHSQVDGIQNVRIVHRQGVSVVIVGVLLSHTGQSITCNSLFLHRIDNFFAVLVLRPFA